MKINYSEKDNGKKVGIFSKGKKIVSVALAALVIGSGMAAVAQAQEMDYQMSPKQQEYYDLGYNEKLGKDVDLNVEWNDENKEFYERGYNTAKEEMAQSEQEKWQSYGENFFKTGVFPENEEWGLDKENLSREETLDIAGRQDAFNKGIEKAVAEGAVIVLGGEVDTTKNLNEMSNQELLTILSNEGWWEEGVNSIRNNEELSQRIVNGSLVDEVFAARGIHLSASVVANAGRNYEILKEKEGKISEEDLKQVLSNTKTSDVKEALDAMQKGMQIDQNDKNNDIEK